MTPSEQHKLNELDKCIRHYNETGDVNAFNRANELRAELGMEQVSQQDAALGYVETALGVDMITPKKGKKK